jgi:hypothetical protein
METQVKDLDDLNTKKGKQMVFKENGKNVDLGEYQNHTETAGRTEYITITFRKGPFPMIKLELPITKVTTLYYNSLQTASDSTLGTNEPVLPVATAIFDHGVNPPQPVPSRTSTDTRDTINGPPSIQAPKDGTIAEGEQSTQVPRDGEQSTQVPRDGEQSTQVQIDGEQPDELTDPENQPLQDRISEDESQSHGVIDTYEGTVAVGGPQTEIAADAYNGTVAEGGPQTEIAADVGISSSSESPLLVDTSKTKDVPTTASAIALREDKPAVVRENIEGTIAEERKAIAEGTIAENPVATEEVPTTASAKALRENTDAAAIIGGKTRRKYIHRRNITIKHP